MSTKFCPACGAEIDAQSNFCPMCGQKIEQAREDTVVISHTEEAFVETEIAPDMGEQISLNASANDELPKSKRLSRGKILAIAWVAMVAVAAVFKEVAPIIGLTAFFAAPVLFVIFVIQAIRKKPKKKWAISWGITLLTFIVMLFIDASACVHEWEAATCDAPKTCVLCEKTEGKANGHIWKDATCTDPKTCSECGETEGEANGHRWKEATCTEAKSCEVCKKKDGVELGHNVSEWKTLKMATCTQEGKKQGTCSVCQKTVQTAIGKAAHQAGEWEITTEATLRKSGEKIRRCEICGAVAERAAVALSQEKQKAAYDAAMSRMTSEFDKIKGVTWYYSKRHPEYVNTRSYVFPYIGDDGQGAWLRLKFDYTGDDWIFFEEITVWVDGKTYHPDFEYKDVQRDADYGDVWEILDISPTSPWVGDVDLDVLWEIVDSKETIVRFEGDDGRYDLTISAQDKAGIKDVLVAYEYMRKH